MRKNRDALYIEKMVKHCTICENTVKRLDYSYENLLADIDLYNSITRSIENLGELAKGISEELIINTKSVVNWKDLKGIRDIIAHGYDILEKDIIWGTATKDIPTLKIFCEEYLQKNSDSLKY
jgi:uncharacterized protein with HEPN domain